MERSVLTASLCSLPSSLVKLWERLKPPAEESFSATGLSWMMLFAHLVAFTHYRFSGLKVENGLCFGGNTTLILFSRESWMS